MSEGNFEWLAKIPIGIMQLGEGLKVRFANDEAKRLMSFFRDPPYRGGSQTYSTSSWSQPCIEVRS